MSLDVQDRHRFSPESADRKLYALLCSLYGPGHVRLESSTTCVPHGPSKAKCGTLQAVGESGKRDKSKAVHSDWKEVLATLRASGRFDRSA